MHCLACLSDPTPAVAICAHCGAGLCSEHVIERDEWLMVQIPINRRVRVAPPARRLLCSRCASAEAAQARRVSTSRSDQRVVS